jgi:hypothetical protein
VTNFEDITPAASDSIDRIYAQFEAEILAGINERLASFEEMKNLIPAQVRNCVVTSITR